MSVTPFSELKSMDIESLNNEVLILKKQLFELRLKKATRQPIKPHLFKKNKKKIAQLLTMRSQKNAL